MNEDDRTQNEDDNVNDVSSDKSCPICEGQSCECSQKENDENISEDNKEKSKEDKLIEEVESLKEEKIRLLAEMENLRKRFDREKVETIKFGSINLARDVLSPGDNLERALSSLPEKEEYSQNIKNLAEYKNTEPNKLTACLLVMFQALGTQQEALNVSLIFPIRSMHIQRDQPCTCPRPLLCTRP